MVARPLHGTPDAVNPSHRVEIASGDNPGSTAPPDRRESDRKVAGGRKRVGEPVNWLRHPEARETRERLSAALKGW